MKSYLAKKGDVQPQWYVVDATNKVLGRVAVEIANVLRGRHKPTYTPHTDTGDFVIVINAEKIALTGRKEDDKQYMFYTGWTGNEYRRSVRHFRENKPEFLITHAVRGMLPRNRLGRTQLAKLKVYAGAKHPHEAQTPLPFPHKQK
ncbi:MAG: 50S ribosomal protein L13 [Opitutales bacterium]